MLLTLLVVFIFLTLIYCTVGERVQEYIGEPVDYKKTAQTTSQLTIYNQILKDFESQIPRNVIAAKMVSLSMQFIKYRCIWRREYF